MKCRFFININRFIFYRFINCLFLFFIGLFCFHSSVASSSEKKVAGQKVETLLENLIQTATSKEPKGKQNLKLQQILRKNCDMENFSREVLQPHWHGATPKQKKEFTRVFTAYFANQLKVNLVKLKGHKIQITKVEKVKNHYMVYSTIRRARTRKNIKWRVSTKEGTPKIFDLIVGGFSASAYESGTIGEMVDDNDGDLDRVIEDLKPQEVLPPSPWQNPDEKGTETSA